MYDVFHRYKVISLFLFFLTLSICLITFQIRIFDHIVLFIFSPVEKTVVRTVDSVRDYFFRYAVLFYLEEEYEQVRRENILLRQKLVEFEEVMQELQRVYRLLGMRSQLAYDTISARVIGKSPITPNSTLIIDKGELDGINKFQGVINSEGVVGRIIGVSRNSAKVQMIIDKNSAVGAMNQRTRDDGIVRGLGFNLSRLHMDFVFYRADFRLGDLIITSGTDTLFPKGLVIGKVTKLIKNKGELFYQVLEIEPSVDFNRIEETLVIRYPSPEASDGMSSESAVGLSKEASEELEQTGGPQ